MYSSLHARERVLPTGTPNLVFAVDSAGRAAATVVGPRSTFVELDTSRPFTAVGIQFKAGGSAPFFRCPAFELANRSVTLDLLWGRDADRLGDRLQHAPTVDQQFRILEHALIENSRGVLKRHAAVAYALRLSDRAQHTHTVADIVQQAGLSSRRFLDVFRDEVGLSPKAFLRVRRFARVLTTITEAPDVDWVEVALACGYFDQPHFNHDFQLFAGVSPSVFRRDAISRTHVIVGR
jgi:AraC-like DNA-binding protein